MRCFTVTFDSWTTDRKLVNPRVEYQLDIGSDSSVNNSLNLIAVYEQTERENLARPPNSLVMRFSVMSMLENNL